MVGKVKTSSNTLEAFVDAFWAGDVESGRSTTCYVLKLHGAFVSWRSIMLSVTALSTAEAEYVALSAFVITVSRFRNVLNQLGENITTVTVHEDKQPAISWASSWGMRTKHLDVGYHHVKHEVETGRIFVKYFPTDKMQADGLTKPLDAQKFHKLVEDLELSLRIS